MQGQVIELPGGGGTIKLPPPQKKSCPEKAAKRTSAQMGLRAFLQGAKTSPFLRQDDRGNFRLAVA